jgi:hypothetical protein
MNIFAIIFWISFFTIFLGHSLFLKLEDKKLDFLQFLALFVLNYIIYTLIDYSSVHYGPDLIGVHSSQTLIGASAGWFVIRTVKNSFRSTHPFLWSITAIITWYYYIF